MRKRKKKEGEECQENTTTKTQERKVGLVRQKGTNQGTEELTVKSMFLGSTKEWL